MVPFLLRCAFLPLCLLLAPAAFAARYAVSSQIFSPPPSSYDAVAIGPGGLYATFSSFTPSGGFGKLWRYEEPLEGGGYQVVPTSFGPTGAVVGYTVEDYYAHPWRGFVEEDGKRTAILGAGYQSVAPAAINRSGTVVGTAYDDYGAVRHPFVWQAGSFSILESGPFAAGQADAINDAGLIVGRLDGHVVTWQDQMLQTYPDDIAGLASGPMMLNQRGTIVGNGSVEIGGSRIARPFVWQEGVPTFLQALTPQANAGAGGINGAGLIVGSSDRRAVAWENGMLVDLNAVTALPAGTTLTGAADVNDEGQILVATFDASTSMRGIAILSPVPEPGTEALTLAGLMAIALRLRRRQV